MSRHPNGSPDPEPEPEYVAETPQEKGARRHPPRNIPNRNKMSECLVCGHVGPRRGRAPVWDENDVGWNECDKGCEPPEGFPVDATCVPCHTGDRAKSIYSEALLVEFFSDHEDTAGTDVDDDRDASTEPEGDHGDSSEDSQPANREEQLSTGRNCFTLRWTPAPREALSKERR